MTMAAASSTLTVAKRDAAGATVSYQNKFIVRAKAFVHAVLPEGRTNPLKKLKRVREKGATKTRERRAADDPDLRALFALDLPDQRRVAYALAAYNGLRRNELAKLTWADV